MLIRFLKFDLVSGWWNCLTRNIYSPCLVRFHDTWISVISPPSVTDIQTPHSSWGSLFDMTSFKRLKSWAPADILRLNRKTSVGVLDFLARSKTVGMKFLDTSLQEMC